MRQVALLSVRRTYGPGAIVFSKGDRGDALYAVASGQVRISAGIADGREVYFNLMEAGEAFGEIALLDGRRRTATATATMRSELIVLAREPFLALLQRDVRLVEHLLQLLCQRIRWTSALAEESALLSVPARLASRLLSLGRLNGRRTGKGIEVAISQEQLARFLGLSRQVINQYLRRWKEQRVVVLGRGKILLADEQALREAMTQGA
jgi:CRP-like cAMP-binding protein